MESKKLPPKHSYRKKSDLCLPEAETGERGDWRKVIKMYKLPVIREIDTSDVMHNLMTTDKTAVIMCRKVVRT